MTEPPRCLLNFICGDGRCPYFEKCELFREVDRIAANRVWYWNFGYAKSKGRKVNGRAKKSDIRYHYLMAMRQGFTCPDCGEVMIFGGDKPRSITIDHKIPRSMGGKNVRDNLRACCRTCNAAKSEKENPNLIQKGTVQ